MTLHGNDKILYYSFGHDPVLREWLLNTDMIYPGVAISLEYYEKQKQTIQNTGF